MATGIVEGLFGVTPEMYQQQQANRAFSEATEFARLSPFQQAGAGIMYGAGQATRGLLGVEDPQLALIRTRQQVGRSIDFADPTSIQQAVNQLASMGDSQGAALLAQEYRKAQESGALLKSKQAETALREGQLAALQQTTGREQELQNALSKLPEDASEQQIQGVLRRYGDPKTVLQALERKNNLDAQLAERRRIQEEQNQFRRDLMEKDQDFKRELARLQADLKAGTTSLQQQLIQEKIDALRQKKQDAIEKQLSTAEGVVDNTKVVLDKIVEAEKLVGKGTAGVGSYLSIIPGTSAKELSTVLGTIKARLGFDQLQQMRNASPTGGALGQVSNRELASLEGALASLDQALSPEALRQNLKQIRESYTRWQEAALGRLPAERQRPDVGGAGATTGKVVDFNSLEN